MSNPLLLRVRRLNNEVSARSENALVRSREARLQEHREPDESGSSATCYRLGAPRSNWPSFKTRYAMPIRPTNAITSGMPMTMAEYIGRQPQRQRGRRRPKADPRRPSDNQHVQTLVQPEQPDLRA